MKIRRTQIVNILAGVGTNPSLRTSNADRPIGGETTRRQAHDSIPSLSFFGRVKRLTMDTQSSPPQREAEYWVRERETIKSISARLFFSPPFKFSLARRKWIGILFIFYGRK
jgi:hypothetical protein